MRISEARRRLALVLLCAASFVAVLDTTIVSVALPSMRRDLGFTTADAQWILNGYALAFGGLLLLGGRAGDLYGRRRLFVAGLAVFAAASLAGGLAPAPWVLVAARALQGVGGAALAPASLALVTTTFAGAQRDRALGVYSAMAGLGFVCGMVLGGVITEFLGWRWVMFVNVPVALAVLLPAPAVIPESRDEHAQRALDVPGSATATLGLAALIYAISEAPKNGWASPVTLGLASLAALLLASFVALERRSRAPLVPPGLLHLRTVAVSNAAMGLKAAIGVSQLFILTLYFQEALGLTPLKTGLLFFPMTLTAVLAASLAGRLVTRFGVKPTSVLGIALLAAGLLLLTGMSADGGLAFVLSGMVIGEAGFMLAEVPLTIAATTAVGADKRALAAGVLNTSIQLGNALGLGVIAAVVAAGASAVAGEAAGPEALVEGLRWALLTGTGFVAASLLLVLAALRDGKSRVRNGTP